MVEEAISVCLTLFQNITPSTNIKLQSEVDHKVYWHPT